MEERLLTIISEVLELPRDRIHLDLRADQVENWDSLCQLNLVSAVESGFNVTIPIEELDAIAMVRDFLRFLPKEAL
jgi:acyl carrier protein